MSLVYHRQRPRYHPPFLPLVNFDPPNLFVSGKAAKLGSEAPQDVPLSTCPAAHRRRRTTSSSILSLSTDTAGLPSSPMDSHPVTVIEIANFVCQAGGDHILRPIGVHSHVFYEMCDDEGCPIRMILPLADEYRSQPRIVWHQVTRRFLVEKQRSMRPSFGSIAGEKR